MLIKKSVLAIAALSLSAAAIANDGAYGVPSNPSFSSDSGFVVGIQGGYGDNHWGDYSPYGSLSSFPGNNISTSGFAARGYVGFDFNQYIGLETGYTYLPTTDVTLFTGVPQFNIKSYAIDLLAKLSVPITNVFGLYAKAGGSYLHSNFSNSLAAPAGDSSSSNIGPAFGVGAEYEVIPNLAIDLSWMRFSGQSNQSVGESYQPSPDVVLLGISYKFPVSYS